MRNEANPHGQRVMNLPRQSVTRFHDEPAQRIIGWRLALLTGAALTLVCGDVFAGDAVRTAAMANTELAQSKDKTKKKSETILLQPIAIDAKADVITGGVQLDSDDLDRIDADTIKDVFRQEPGVTVGSPMSISQKIYVNGIEDTNLSVDIDGARQANKTYHHIGTTVIDPGLLKAVKIESGVAPADAGPQALAGSISLETKDGRDLVKAGNTFGGFGKLSYNTNTQGFSEDLALAANHDGFDIMAYGTKSGGKDYDDGDGNTVQGSRPDSTNFIGKLGYTAPNGYRIKFSATRYDDIALRDARTNFGLPSSFGTSWTDYSRQSTTLSFGDETPSDMWDPKASISRTVTHLDTEQFASTRNIIARVESINGKASNTFTTNLGKITTGGDFYVDEGTGGVTSVSQTTRREKATNIGVFAQARSTWTEDFRTSVGARVDRNKLVGNKNETLVNTGASGNVNAEYDITRQVMGYAGVGSVFGGVPMTEVGVQTSDRIYTGVEPSRSYTGKVGANVAVGDFTVDGHVFRTRIKNAHDLTVQNRATNYDLTTEGANVSVRYDYTEGFVRAGYSRATVRLDSAIPNSGSNDYYQGTLFGDMFTIEATHRFDDLGLRVGTTNEYVLENGDTRNARGFALNGYFVSNIFAEWKPEQVNGLSFRADVNNLLDRPYSDRANNGSYSTNNSVASLNDPGRSVILSAKLEF